MRGAAVLLVFVVGCLGQESSKSPSADLRTAADLPPADLEVASPADAARDLGLNDSAAPVDAAPMAGDLAGSCAVSGAPGRCITTTACAALGDHTSYAGYCPGPADIQCCIQTPSASSNPPTPAGYRPMTDTEVTPAMTTWAVAILHDPTTYPMFSTAMMTFGTVMVLARVEWHIPDFQNSVVHRGVTLYEPL